MLRLFLGILVSVFIVNSANAFMMGADVAEMVTAPFSLHKTGDNDIPVPKSVQKAMDLFSSDDEEVDLSGYMKILQQKVEDNFNPPEVEGSPTTVVFFKLTRTGRLDSFKVIKSSGNELFDHASVRAIQMSAPFDYLPSGYEKDLLKVQYTFTKRGMSVNYF